MTVKYIVIGEYIKSRLDGEMHYVPCNRLIELYGVKKSECTCMTEEDTYIPYNDIIIQTSGLTILKPQYNGDYTIKGN